jgi:hypothetical protein
VYSVPHSVEPAGFVSIVAKVDRFSTVAAALREAYGAEAANGSIFMTLDAEDFQAVMNLLLQYGAVVTQREPAEGLTANQCVIMPK